MLMSKFIMACLLWYLGTIPTTFRNSNNFYIENVSLTLCCLLLFVGIAAILTTILISAPEADGRRVNSQKFDKVFTNQTLEHYARHVVRGVAECTSMCISDKLVDCKAFSLRESQTRSKECLLYDTTIVSLVTYESSAHSFSVHVKRGKAGSLQKSNTLIPLRSLCLQHGYRGGLGDLF